MSIIPIILSTFIQLIVGAYIVRYNGDADKMIHMKICLSVFSMNDPDCPCMIVLMHMIMM
jgi:hypothetical protein